MDIKANKTDFQRTFPNLILYNARIHTVNTKQPYASAIAITGDHVFAVGNDDDIRRLGNADTRQIDMEGAAILPGFIDAHCHVLSTGISHLKCVNCDLRTIPEIKAALRKKVETTPDEWVVGFLYDDTKTVERRNITRNDLNEVSTEKPVLVMHRGGHTVFVNSKAFERAGIPESIENPVGGVFERDAQTGRLNGRVAEHAAECFSTLFDTRYTENEYQQAVKLISQKMNQAGITSAHDMWVVPDELAAYQQAKNNGDLTLRVNCMMIYNHLDSLLTAGVRSGLGDSWVRVGGLKLLSDGSISERTAYLSEPYIGRKDDHGILVMDEEALYSYASKAHKAGWQIAVHANGDAAIDKTLRVYERLQQEMPRKDARYRIEHCTVVNDNLIARIKALGAIPTPFAAYVYYRGEIMEEYGADRVKQMFALRSFLDAGIPAAPGSDYPPGPFEPMMALRSGVTRTDWAGRIWGQEQRITVPEAIRCATLHGAYASCEEQIKGSLEPGKLADLVVLGADPEKVDPLELIDIPVWRTMVGGKWVYEA